MAWVAHAPTIPLLLPRTRPPSAYTWFAESERMLRTGAFPLWLAPVQVKVMPITDRTNNYAKHVADRLEKAGLRVETDLRNEKIGYKIREAQSQKIPYMLVLGDKEAENDTISVRTLSGEQSVEGLSDFIARLQADVKSRKS